jgi:hypothetical protein
MCLVWLPPKARLTTLLSKEIGPALLVRGAFFAYALRTAFTGLVLNNGLTMENGRGGFVWPGHHRH